MCIVCNCGNVGDEYLSAFEDSRRAMADATGRMLACSQSAKTPSQRKAYDAIHKRMVRLSADWNRLEQQREKQADLLGEPV